MVLLACIAGVIYPYRKGWERWQFALGACASLVLLAAVVPRTDGGASLLPLPFVFLLLACVVGLFYPYIPKTSRKHFAIGAVASLVGMVAIMPEPTPEQLAAREAEEEREAAEEARLAVLKAGQEAKAAHRLVIEKAMPALEVAPNYTRDEYGNTYSRVGAATFAKLNELEPGAAYAAAESRWCDRVLSAMVSDVSKPGAATWFVDCDNDNRFMVTQKQASAALERFEAGKLAKRDLEPGCTLSSVSRCKEGAVTPLSPAQMVAKEKEIEFVSACDTILQITLVSPASLDLHRWSYGFADDHTVVVERPFDSQNSFGATIRSTYRCEIDALTTNIEGFSVSGPMGRKKVI